MQIIVIAGPDYETALPRVKKALEQHDGIELRLDLFQTIEISQVASLRDLCRGKTVVFTLRSKKQGGGFSGKEEDHHSLIEKFIKLEPDFFDLEDTTDPLFIKYLMRAYPKVSILLSYHDFIKTPRNLAEKLDQMETAEAHAYKIAVTANSESDSYKMLHFIGKQHALGKKFTGICMGDLGKITRTEAKNFFQYRILHSTDLVAPGLDFA